MAKATKVLQNPEVDADPEIIRATLERYEVAVPKRASVKKLADTLRAAYKSRIEDGDIPEDDWVQCPVCKEITDDDEDLESCPFCGDLGEEDEPERKTGRRSLVDDSLVDDPDPIETEDPNVDDDIADEPPTVDIDPKTTAASEKKAAAEAKKKEAADKKAKAVTDKKAKADAKKKAAADKAAAKLAKKTGRPAKDIAAAVHEKHGELVSTAYAIGLLLQEAKTSETWRDEGFKSFRDWHTKATPYGSKFVNGIINAVRVFSAPDFAKVGHSKLMLIANVSDPDREKLLADAKAGASKRAIEAAAKEANEKARGADSKNPIGTDSRGTARGGKAGRPNAEEQSITLIGKVGGKPKTHRFHDKKTGGEVKQWEKDAFVAVKISAGVVMYLALKTDRKGEKITGISTMFQRVEDAADAAE